MKREGQAQLAILDRTSRALAEAKTVEQIVAIRDQAEAFRFYAKSARLGLEAQNYAAEIKLRSERRAGAMLSELRLRGGNRKSKSREDTLKLRDLGISKKESSRWQKEASVPEREFTNYLRTTNQAGKEVSSAGLVRLATKLAGGTKNRVQRIKRRVDNTSKNGLARASCDKTVEVVDELENHRSLLADILRREHLTAAGNNGLMPAERRMVDRLLVEVKQLLAELKQLLAQEKVDRPQ